MTNDVDPSLRLDSPELLVSRVAELEEFIDQRTANVAGQHQTVENNTPEAGYYFSKHKIIRLDNGEYLFYDSAQRLRDKSIDKSIDYSPPDSPEGKKASYSLHLKSDGSVKITHYSDSRPEAEYVADSVQEAAQSPDFAHHVNIIYEAAMSGKFDRNYERHEVPKEIVTEKLSDQELKTIEVALRAHPMLNNLKNVPHPAVRMTDDTGESWLASDTVEADERKYIVLYRPREVVGNITYETSVVYTSLTQANWRLLPGIGHKNWHRKPTDEQFIGLPYIMQKSLWEHSATNHPHVYQGEDEVQALFDDLRELTNEAYDEILSGKETPAVIVAKEDDKGIHIDEKKMPSLSQNDEPIMYTFDSQLYGIIDARQVPSVDGSLTYLTYTRKSDGLRWIGMVQVNDAKMLDTYILDKSVMIPKSFVASPREYHFKTDIVGAEVSDNTRHLLNSPALHALNGTRHSN